MSIHLSYEDLETLVGHMRRLGITHYRSERVELHLTATAPAAVIPKPDQVAAQTPSCPCGHPPWVCNGKGGTCKRGCAPGKCKPVPAPPKLEVTQ